MRAFDIHTSGPHPLSIINDVLDMSKIKAGKLEIHEEDILLRDLLAGSARMVRERGPPASNPSNWSPRSPIQSI